MIQMIWPMLIVVTANTFYNIIAKHTPEDVNAFFTLTVTYLTAAVISFVIFLFTSNSSVSEQVTRINWTAFAFAASILWLEVGYIFIYRAGWKVSMASLVANISLACVLLVVGYFVYREQLSTRQLIGIATCIAGFLFLLK